RLRRLPRDRFYVFERGVIVDDIYLSRQLLSELGRGAICQAPEARVWFSPPETFAGMYTTYKRMRWEAERLNKIFPETKSTNRRDELRRNDWDRMRRVCRRERWLWRVFHAAHVLCALRYEGERFFYQNLAWGQP